MKGEWFYLLFFCMETHRLRICGLISDVFLQVCEMSAASGYRVQDVKGKASRYVQCELMILLLVNHFGEE